MTMTLNRRRLFQATAGLVVSFSLPAGRALAQAQVDPAAIPTAGFGGKPVSPTIVESYIAIDKDGQVTLYTGKVDLGTGVQTAFTQILAEELDVPFAAVSTITGDTALTPDQGADQWQPVGPGRRHADPSRRRDRASRVADLGCGPPESAGCRPHRQGRRGACRLRRFGHLCRAAARLEAADAQRGQCRAAEIAGRLHPRRQIRAARGHSGEDVRDLHLCAGFPPPRHAAWPRDPSARGGRDPAFGRSQLGAGLGADRPQGQFPGGRRHR